MNDITTQLVEVFNLGGPEERCGIITAEGEVVHITNTHEDPTVGFYMDPEEFLSHVEDAVATWHTHPNGDATFSEEDYAGFLQWPSLAHYIVGQGGEIRGYRVEDQLVLNIP